MLEGCYRGRDRPCTYATRRRRKLRNINVVKAKLTWLHAKQALECKIQNRTVRVVMRRGETQNLGSWGEKRDSAVDPLLHLKLL